MTYQFELDVSTSLDALTVERIISNIVAERTGKTVDKIITRIEDGKFAGFNIHFVSELSETNILPKERIIDKTFKVFKWDQ